MNYKNNVTLKYFNGILNNSNLHEWISL
ncbi:MAG: hypothetical protein RLZZ236_1655, partial [Bacteroidota bacterium]